MKAQIVHQNAGQIRHAERHFVSTHSSIVWFTVITLFFAVLPGIYGAPAISPPTGWLVYLGKGAQAAIEAARNSEARFYTQTADAAQADALRRAAEEAGVLGTRVFVQQGSPVRLHLADNLADAVVLSESKATFPKDELMRVLRPGGKLITPEGEAIKPFPPGVDDWTHPYHGPDNNPQSRDSKARAPYLTQFTAEPWYCPMPIVTVTAGGRLFKAFGHIAIKEREWPLLNTLIAQDAFNGTLLWKRPLSDGFMIHRNTLIATPAALFVGDDHSCKVLDPATGEVQRQILVPPQIKEGPSWKWMALVDGVLYAMVGPSEPPDPNVNGVRQARGWPWAGTTLPLGKGYNSKVYPWGFGHTILAIDPNTQQLRWAHREEAPLDARGMCQAGGRIFFYSHGQYLGALDQQGGKELWKTSDPALLAAVGEHRKAQNPTEGFSSSSFLKASDKMLYFAGPTRDNLVAVSAADGALRWQVAGRGNSQLVLREEGLYAMGPKESTLYDALTGQVKSSVGARVNCTRATGSAESIFVRGGRDGTIRYDLGTDKAQHFCAMRPTCQDGVLAAYGQLFWGPWMCDCNLTLVGVIALTSAGDFDFNPPVQEQDRLEMANAGSKAASFAVDARDWPVLRANNQRTAYSPVSLRSGNSSSTPNLLWTFIPKTATQSTAPIAAGDWAFVAGLDGAVRALDVASGKLRWIAYTGGGIHYPPALWEGRLYVGSGDGWLYALEAKTGRQLWRFRGAPAERMIPVYGALRSTWPVASGAMVENGIVYAAAGMANHDGTHIYALDAVSGRLRWHNGESGSVDPKNSGGISINGHLLLQGNDLWLAGGNMLPAAKFDSKTGKCLTDSAAPPSHTIFRAGSDLFLSGEEVVAGGFPLYAAAVGDYRVAGPMVLQTPAGTISATWGPHDSKISLLEAGGSSAAPKARWTQSPVNRPYGLAVTPDAVLVTGTRDAAGRPQPSSNLVVALDLKTGDVLWKHPLPASPAPWGLAIDRTGRVLVSLKDGRLLAYGAK